MRRKGHFLADLAFLTPYYPYRGGIALHSAYLVDALHNMGVQITLLSYRRQYPAWLYPGASQFEPSPPAVDLLTVGYLYDPLNPATWEDAHKAIQKSGAGVLVMPWWHTVWTPGYVWLAQRLEKDGIKVIYLVHNVLPHKHHPCDMQLARLALGLASGYIVQSVSQKTAVEKLLGSPSHIELVPHPLYPPQAALPSREEARQKLGIPDADTLFLSFGFQRLYKGLTDLVSAFETLGDTTYAHLAVIGEGWVKEASATAFIHRLDTYLPAEELMRWIAAADWFVAANRRATQSGSLALAMGCGMPLIISDVLAFQAVGTSQSHMEIFPAGEVVVLSDILKNAMSIPPTTRDLPDIRPGWQALAQAVIRLSDL
jgi:glycosyltransferase involved in cell wall biosynthesis